MKFLLYNLVDSVCFIFEENILCVVLGRTLEKCIETGTTAVQSPYFAGETINIECKAAGYSGIIAVYFTASTDPGIGTDIAACESGLPTLFAANDRLS